MTIEPIHHNEIATRCSELAVRIAGHTDSKGNGVHPTALERLEFLRDGASTTICSVYEPAIAIIVQGHKEILLGEETYRYGVAQCLVVSVDLPVRTFIVNATLDKPFLGFLLKLSSPQLYNLVTQIQDVNIQP